MEIVYLHIVTMRPIINILYCHKSTTSVVVREHQLSNITIEMGRDIVIKICNLIIGKADIESPQLLGSDVEAEGTRI